MKPTRAPRTLLIDIADLQNTDLSSMLPPYAIEELNTEPQFENLLRSPGIDSQPGGIDSCAPQAFTNTGSALPCAKDTGWGWGSSRAVSAKPTLVPERQSHGLINYIDTKAKCHLKKPTCKRTSRQMFICLRPPPLLGFLFGWSSNSVGSECGQKQSVKLLQNMVGEGELNQREG
jgi:hypothetical protein